MRRPECDEELHPSTTSLRRAAKVEALRGRISKPISSNARSRMPSRFVWDMGQHATISEVRAGALHLLARAGGATDAGEYQPDRGLRLG